VKLDLHGIHVVAKQGLREERRGRRGSRAVVGGGEAWEERVSSGSGRRRGTGGGEGLEW
jgi:hypothetical protein